MQRRYTRGEDGGYLSRKSLIRQADLVGGLAFLLFPGLDELDEEAGYPEKEIDGLQLLKHVFSPFRQAFCLFLCQQT